MLRQVDVLVPLPTVERSRSAHPFHIGRLAHNLATLSPARLEAESVRIEQPFWLGAYLACLLTLSLVLDFDVYEHPEAAALRVALFDPLCQAAPTAAAGRRRHEGCSLVAMRGPLAPAADVPPATVGRPVRRASSAQDAERTTQQEAGGYQRSRPRPVVVGRPAAGRRYPGQAGPGD